MLEIPNYAPTMRFKRKATAGNAPRCITTNMRFKRKATTCNSLRCMTTKMGKRDVKQI